VVLTAGLRASHDSTPDLRAVGTIIATITLPELEAGVGTGWLTGSDQPIPAGILQRMACDAKIRVMVLGTNNTPLYETVLSRYFIPAPTPTPPNHTTPGAAEVRTRRRRDVVNDQDPRQPVAHGPVHAAFAPRHPQPVSTRPLRGLLNQRQTSRSRPTRDQRIS
jgi:hypothetical protein